MIKSTVKINEDAMRRVFKAETPWWVYPSNVLSGLLLFGFFAAWMIYSKYYSPILIGIVVLLAVWTALLSWPMVRRGAAKRIKNRTIKLYGVPEETFSSEFYDDGVISRSLTSGAQSNIPYESLIACYETDDLIILRTKALQRVFVSKTEVDKDEFFEFLRSKSTAIKWKQDGK